MLFDGRHVLMVLAKTINLIILIIMVAMLSHNVSATRYMLSCSIIWVCFCIGCFSVSVTVNNEPIQLQLCDTAGQVSNITSVC